MTIEWTPKRIPGWDWVYSWESQANQYAPLGAPGIGYERHYANEHDAPPGPPVDCLLMRDRTGVVVGILNHYPVGGEDDLEQAGNINVWTRPDRQKRGIAKALLREAKARWDLDPRQQRYSAEGLALLHSLDRDGEL